MKRALIAAALLLSASAMAGPKIAITFDDLPAHGVLPAGMTRVEIAQQVIDALKTGGIPPTYGFVNGALIDGEPAAAPVLTLWHASGNLLGNHTWSHPGLSKLSVADYEAEITRNEPLIAGAAGSTDWHWFRYPFIDEGKDAEQRAVLRSFVAGRGYKIATVSIVVGDWDYPAPYARCLAKNDSAAIAKLEAMYLTQAEQSLAHSRSLASTLYGHDISHILLLHIGSFQAHMLPTLIALYKAKGARFISLEEAVKDPAYRAYADPSLPAPPRDMEHALAERQLPTPRAPSSQGDELAAICK
jgi:peptidoglycan/xylan/chitin deacetylase (PgdA/CDA1 family)